MSLLSSILLGLIQGLAEFLPISSSGHLAIAEHFLGQAGVPATPDFFDVLLHLGTLVAVFAAYWQDIRDMIVELIDGVRDLVRGTTPNPIPPARRMILLIIVGTLPLFVVLPVKDLVEGLSGNIYFVAGALIVTGFLLFASDRVKKGRKTERSAKLLDVLLVRDVTRLKVAQVIGKYKAGQYRQLPDLIRYFRCKSITVEADHPVAVNLDGELLTLQKAAFAVAPEKIRFCVPQGLHWNSSVPQNQEKSGVYTR